MNNNKLADKFIEKLHDNAGYAESEYMVELIKRDDIQFRKDRIEDFMKQNFNNSYKEFANFIKGIFSLVKFITLTPIRLILLPIFVSIEIIKHVKHEQLVKNIKAKLNEGENE